MTLPAASKLYILATLCFAIDIENEKNYKNHQPN